MTLESYTKTGPSQDQLRVGHMTDVNLRTGDVESYEFDQDGNDTWMVPGFSDQGQYNDRWREEIASGLNAGTDRQASKYNVRLVSEGLYVHRWTDSNDSDQPHLMHLSGPMALTKSIVGGMTIPSYPMPSDLANSALARFIRKLDNMDTAFQGGVALGELRETAHLLRSSGKTLITRMTELLKSEWTKPKRYRKPRYRGYTRQKVVKSNLTGWTDQYLKSVFGWAPLISDIEDLSKAFSGIELPLNQKVRAGERRVRNGIHDEVNSRPLGIGHHPGQVYSGCAVVDYLVNDKITDKVSYYGVFRRDNPSWLTPVGLGFGLRNWIPTVWELIPYSFLVDYFTNLSEMITIRTGLRSKLAWVNRTYRQDVSRSIVLGRLVPLNATSSTSGSGGSAEITRKYVERVREPNVTLGFQLEVPPVTSLKWLSMAALGVAHLNLRSIVTLR